AGQCTSRIKKIAMEAVAGRLKYLLICRIFDVKQEEMSVQVSKRLINVSEYYRMAEAGILTENDRVERIHGEIIEMSPIGSKHAAMVNRLNDLLKECIGKKAIVSVQNPIALNPLNEPEPDITILKYKGDYYDSGHPGPDDILIVIEVADTTRDYDQEIKI